MVFKILGKKEFDSFHEKNPNHIGWDYGQELCQIQDFHSRGSGRTTYRNFFKNKEESSCPHSYYAKTDKKRIFVNYPLILFDILIPSLIRRRIAVFRCRIFIYLSPLISISPLKKLEQKDLKPISIE